MFFALFKYTWIPQFSLPLWVFILLPMRLDYIASHSSFFLSLQSNLCCAVLGYLVCAVCLIMVFFWSLIWNRACTWSLKLCQAGNLVSHCLMVRQFYHLKSHQLWQSQESFVYQENTSSKRHAQAHLLKYMLFIKYLYPLYRSF